MKKEFDLKIEGGTLEGVQIDPLNSLMIATYTRDVSEFKAGDILIDAYDEDRALEYVSIFKGKSKIDDTRFSAFIAFKIYSGTLIYALEDWDEIKNNRLATDEEKQLLFDALKKQGKRWNAEKLEIEKLAPEFKRGDILASKISPTVLVFDKYTRCDEFSSIINNSDIVSNNNWNAEIFRHASAEEIEVFYKDLARMGKKWNAETLELEELEELDISEIVVDYESAIKYLGIKDLLLVFKNYYRAEKFNAQIKLQLIAEAWNKFDEFEADWDDLHQKKFFTTFSFDEGELQIDYEEYTYVLFDSQSANFSFKTEERANQFAEQFIDLFKVAFGF